jgi:hypothetical protein
MRQAPTLAASQDLGTDWNTPRILSLPTVDYTKHSDHVQPNAKGNNNNTRKYFPYSMHIRTNKIRFRKSLRHLENDHIDSTKYITNLSSRKLNDIEVKVLSKGLTFVPCTIINKENLSASLTRFERSNRLRYYFRNSAPLLPHPFRKKSAWIPPPASPAIEAYLKRVRAQVNHLEPKPYTYNLTRKEKSTLQELARDHTLVIKAADKGSGIVVEDRDRYIQAGLDHLSDDKIYEATESDPTLPLVDAIDKYVSHMYNKGIVDSITRDFLTFPKEPKPRTQQGYFLKKIHKNPIAVRPIVSGSGGPTERISQFIDLHLQPFVPQVNSYIRDSGHLIQILENSTFPAYCTLATIDVSALYLNIPHDEGIKAVLNRLYNNNPLSDEVTIPPNTMSDLLKIVLTRNYFQFADKMYHQIQGTAMGTKMAPAYANLFMAELEENILANSTTKPLLWKRFIDDILCIWPDSAESLRSFLHYLNSVHPSIKFTHECSATSIDFLDITIHKGDRFKSTGKLDIQPFFKKTNKFQYLHYSSAHPKNVFTSLIKGEMTRLLRNCSSETEYLRIQNKMQSIFRDRGYPRKLISETISQVNFSNRQQALDKQSQQQCPYDTFLVTEYTSDLNTQALRQILKPAEDEQEHIPTACLSLKKTKNLSKILVRAKLKNCPDPPQSDTRITIPITPNMEGHSAGCATPGCKCCRAMSRKVRVSSTSHYKSFPTARHTSCNTCNVIYLLECSKCTKCNQYVGQTQRPLSQRLAGHRAASTKKTNLPLYKHFAAARDHIFERDATMTILEKTTRTRLNERESHWISALDTVFPKGLNSRYE